MGVAKAKAEYEDLAALARKHGVPLDAIRKAVSAAAGACACDMPDPSAQQPEDGVSP